MAKTHESIIKITPKTAKAVKGIRAVGKAAKKLVPSLNQVKNASLLTTAAVAGLTVGIWALVKSTAAAGDEFDKMSKRLGVSAQTLSELKFAAELSGASIDDIEKSIKKLSRSAVDADRGLLTYQRAFDDLGIEVRDTNDNLKDSETLFNEVSAALVNLESNTKKTALAQELFGKSGTKLIPLFKEGADGIEAMREQARLFNVTFSDDAAAASAAFVDAQKRLTDSITGTKFAIADKLMPPMTEFFNASALWIADHRTDVADMATTWIMSIAGMTESVLIGGATLIDWGNKTASAYRSATLAIAEMELFTAKLALKVLPDTSLAAATLQGRIFELTVAINNIEQKQIISDNDVNNADRIRALIAEIKTSLIPDEGGAVKPNIFDADPANQTAREDQIKNMLLLEREFFVKERALDNARHAAEKKKIAIIKNLRRQDFADFVNNLQAIGNVSSSAFKVWQIGAAAQATVTGITATQEAWRAGMQTPVPWAPVIASGYATAAALAAGARVSAILSQSYSGGGGSIPSGGGGVSVGGFSQEQQPLLRDTSELVPSVGGELPGRTVNIEINVNGSLVDHAGLVDELAPFIDEAIEDKVININVT